MFENLLGQERIVSLLTGEVITNTLPSSVLFYGDEYTGKSTAALELARVLLCEKKTAEWNCPCRSCEQNRVLVHPALALTGTDHFAEEIAAAGKILGNSDRKAAAYMFIRSVRKIIRRFDPWVWEAKDQKEKKIEEAVTEIEEVLADLSPDNPLPDRKKVEKAVSSCTEKALALASEIPENVPVDTIRTVTSWVHTTTESRNKIVIIENGDRMADSARNALLKTLEEPPKGVYFILITTRKGRLIPTVLSRLRHYHFPARTQETERDVLEKIFREDSGNFDNLASYFLSWKSIPVHEYMALAEEYVARLLGPAGTSADFLIKVSDMIKTKEQARFFLSECEKELLRRLREGVRNGKAFPEADSGGKWLDMLRDCLIRIEGFNQKPSLGIESLFYSMRSVI